MPDKDLRLLALDGGGVRGLSALMILEQLMEAVNPEDPPKPCDYFDMMGGTSTGGLIAVMLGRLKMSVTECIEAYLSLSDRIFQKKKHRVTVKGSIQGRFDSTELARAVKDVLTARGLPEDALLKDTSDDSCRVFVCATSKETSETVCFTSYKSPRGGNDLLESVRIWEACRATSAASSFFDPISIGRYKEEFVDGATGANNPVWEVWNQAQLLWGPRPIEENIKCLISIGTGVPSLKIFRDDVLHIGKTLLAIATETEQTAENFRRHKSRLDDCGQYYRFNVDRGLEEIGLEESKKKKEIAAATRRYIESQAVFQQIQACADNIARRNYSGQYQTIFSLEGVPKVGKFIERPNEMAQLERALLPTRQHLRQRMFVLHGLGGIGKTQLAVEFTRQHRQKFSAVFWLDGTTKDSLLQSIANCASRIPEGQISKVSRAYATELKGNIDIVVREVMDWLARDDNTDWLLVFDNVDRDYGYRGPKPELDAYDVTRYFSGADHGSILITTRLAKLGQLGESFKLDKVDQIQAEAIFRSRYTGPFDSFDGQRLFDKIDGLPLAIAQAAAFLQESGYSTLQYIDLYDKQWEELMVSRDWAGAPLQDYPGRCIWTTWAISYNAIRERHPDAANMLLLWAWLDSKDLWYGLFAAAYSANKNAAKDISKWVGDIAQNEVKFANAIRLLQNYSLVEETQVSGSHVTHPVVHKWALYFQGEDSRSELARLAMIILANAIPDRSSPQNAAIQRRIFHHVRALFRKFGIDHIHIHIPYDGVILSAFHDLGNLYQIQGKEAEGEKILQLALEGYEKVFGLEHKATLSMVNNLGVVYYVQQKLVEAERMWQRALDGYEKTRGPEHGTTLNSYNNLGALYHRQGKLIEAEQMLQRALQGYEKALGVGHASTVNIYNNLGVIYWSQGKLDEAEQMYQRALQGYETAFGPERERTLGVVSNLGLVYHTQGKLIEAEQMFQRTVRGYEKLIPGYQYEAHEKTLSPEYASTLNATTLLGNVYRDQGKLAQAAQMYQRAMRGYERTIGTDKISTNIPALDTIRGFASIDQHRGDLVKAHLMYSKTLDGYQKTLGPDHPESQKLQEILHNLDIAIRNNPLKDLPAQSNTSQNNLQHPHTTKASLEDVPEQSNASQNNSQSLDTTKPPLKSKWYQSFRKLKLK